MRYFYLSASLICFLLAGFGAWENFSGLLFIFFVLVAGWLGYLGLNAKTLSENVVLKFGGVQWTEEDFCRGWEIDGRTGSGKTASGVVPIIYQLKKNRPQMGIVALDTKGDLSEPLARIAEDLNRVDDLVQLEVRPENAALDLRENPGRCRLGCGAERRTSLFQSCRPNHDSKHLLGVGHAGACCHHLRLRRGHRERCQIQRHGDSFTKSIQQQTRAGGVGSLL
jgi:hypothetical protein